MNEDWLDPDAGAAQEAQRVAALETASLYLVFQTDERGRQLLALWDRQLRRRRTPVDASIQQYAANEALRAFVEGIYDQIEMAKQLKGAISP